MVCLYVSFGPEGRVYENQRMSREDPTHHHAAAPYQAGVAATTPLEQHPTWTPNEANDDAPKQVRFQSHSYTFPHKEQPQQQQQQQREEKRGSMFMWVIFLIGVVLILLVAAYRFYTFRSQPEESQTDDYYYDTHGTESPQTDTGSPSIKDSTTHVSQDELYRWMLHVNERLQTMDQKLNQLDKSSSGTQTQYTNYSDTGNVSYDEGDENENDDEDDNNNDDQSGPYHGTVEEFARFFAQVDPSGGSEFYSYAKPPPEDLEYVQNEYESHDKEAQEEDNDNDNDNDNDEEKGQDNQEGETAVSTADSTVNNTGGQNIDAMTTTTEPPQTGSEDQSEDFVPPVNSSMQGGNENYL